MPWNIRVIHRSIKLTENVPPALKNLKNTPHTINQPIGHLGCEWNFSEEVGREGTEQQFFLPRYMCAQIKHPSAQRFDFRAVPSAGWGARTHICISSPFKNALSHTIISLFCLSQYTKGYCSCKKTQPLISPQPNRNLVIHPAQNWNTQLMHYDLGLLQVWWFLPQGRGKNCNITLHSSHLSNPCLIKWFTLSFPRQD